ncbi:Light-independent protochlorophyllide reductase subunit N [Gossypium arboreum]|uniref:Light-independent protochlorophyllide reductase subunit N n=1 Tax=Gossypium arboreum TaxID=29729 RepID=A0A0B0P0T7_GOSAR|nr:Light-independent protochlorophyllide reductase subunit N [Gossypium arboreum]
MQESRLMNEPYLPDIARKQIEIGRFYLPEIVVEQIEDGEPYLHVSTMEQILPLTLSL